MRLYLSSYRQGSATNELLELVPPGALVGVCANALDNQEDDAKRQVFRRESKALLDLGYRIEEFDLRTFFPGAEDNMESALRRFSLLWVTGGNAFVLMLAMRLSAFEKEIRKVLSEGSLTYGGYSAGAVVAGKSLRGIERVDKTDDFPLSYPKKEICWDALGLVPYSIVPHYRSNHPESSAIENVVKFLDEKGLPYKALRDGEVDIHR
jgi:dipeptidase E